ncbi:hypothetical protein Nepgr_009267 [Nepenthes gracilis]|uniref:Uncharacterized protein n=1 Tax=Nepenthes gracilis TaxID=150966 RepID=A0AAD3SB37_NEPGR|nr:hypothetical protein Nepgr_009267 [Nepenthes gracilis]
MDLEDEIQKFKVLSASSPLQRTLYSVCNALVVAVAAAAAAAAAVGRWKFRAQEFENAALKNIGLRMFFCFLPVPDGIAASWMEETRAKSMQFANRVFVVEDFEGNRSRRRAESEFRT